MKQDEYVERLKKACLEVGIDEGFVARKTRWAKIVRYKDPISWIKYSNIHTLIMILVEIVP